MNTGWCDNVDNSSNIINNNWFGFRVAKFNNRDTLLIGWFINSKRYGWSVDYNHNGSIDLYLSGYYINNEKYGKYEF